MKNLTFNSIINFRSAKIILFFLCTLISCKNDGQQSAITIEKKAEKHSREVVVGANCMYPYIKDSQDKNIGLITNQTGIVRTEKGKCIRLVDTLLKKKIKLTKVLAPEHGFGGEAGTGEVIKDGKDIHTGLLIVSLYGKNKKPTAEQLKSIDLVLSDLQDIGARLYTYISILYYMMEACAEAHIPLIVLDRPDPNGHYIDGPVLQSAFKSFIGMHPVPVVHGMTTGEYTQTTNGEERLAKSVTTDSKVISLANYTHQTVYSSSVRPSPNLPNDASVNLYPSLRFSEGTNVSMGRGANKQFQIYGAPYFDKTAFHSTPKPDAGDKSPKSNGKVYYGEDLSRIALSS